MTSVDALCTTLRLTALAGALILCIAPRPAQGQLRGPEIRDVLFVGNETFPSDSLAHAIATRKTECRSTIFRVIPFCAADFDFAVSRSQLRERDLPRDRARLILYYRQRGFRDVQVDSAEVVRDGERAEVTFRVVEGRPVVADSVTFLGLDGVEEADAVLNDLPFQTGDRLSTLTLDATRDSIVNRLSNRGYAYADVFRTAFRPADDPYNASVTFEVVPGPVTRYGEVRVNGIENLETGTVLRTAQLSGGDTYRLNDIIEAEGRLYGLDIVRSASVVPDTVIERQDSIIDVTITVQEGDAYRVLTGAGWSTSECMNLEARWTSRNFFGGGRRLQVRARVGNILAEQYRDILCTQSGQNEFAELTGLASVEFVQPWIFSTRNSLSASIFVERQSLPDIFVRRAVGAQLALSRAVGAQTVLTTFYRPELSQLDADDVLYCTGFLVCAPEDVASLEGANWLSPVGVNLARDRSDDLLDPRSGYRTFVEFEHAASWTGSDFRYDRVVAEASRYDPIGSAVFATRVRGGWVGSGGFSDFVRVGDEDGIIHPQKRFFTGGANSVRGFAQSRLGPRVLFSEPSDLLDMSEGDVGGCTPESLEDLSCQPGQETVVDPRPTGGTRVVEANAELRFHVWSFLDGVVFTDVGQAWGAGESVRFSSLEFTPGMGIRIPTPVGPIRLDVAYRFRGPEDLDVVSEQIRPYDFVSDDEDDRIEIVTADGPQAIDWISTGQLVQLTNPFRFGADDRGFQLHISIGQAF